MDENICIEQNIYGCPVVKPSTLHIQKALDLQVLAPLDHLRVLLCIYSTTVLSVGLNSPLCS